MDADARNALVAIRGCVRTGRYVLTQHFGQRLNEGFFFWSDVLAVLEAPTNVRVGVPDRLGRPKWIVTGETSDRLVLEVVCVLDHDEYGKLTLFVTIYEA